MKVVNMQKENFCKVKRQPHTFEELCIVWLNQKQIRLKYSSTAKYAYLFHDYIFPEFGKLTFPEINLIRIEQGMANIYESCKTESASPSLMKSILYLINAVLNYGSRLGYFIPIKAIFELPRMEKARIQTLNFTQEKSLVSYLMEHKNSNSLGIMISLLTGIRLGEVCSLKVEDIDMEKSIIYVRTTVQRLKSTTPGCKTELIVTTPKSRNSYREIPFPALLHNYLRIYGIQRMEAEEYILSCCNIPYEPRTLQYGFAATLKKCGIEHMNYHCLRHTFATNCIKAGFDVKTLSELLGHTSVNFTLNRYVHSDIEFKRKQMNLLGLNYVDLYNFS